MGTLVMVGHSLHNNPASQSTSSQHIGNLHLNIVAEDYTPEVTTALEPFVYELVGEFVWFHRFVYVYY